jgi:hypothetical protein
MSTYQLPIAGAGARAELRRLVDQLREALERSVADQGQVVRGAVETNDEEFSQDLRIESERGALEVAVQYGKRDGRAEVSVAPESSSWSDYLPMALALLAALLADQLPELLPVFRGLRVLLGAVTGLVVGCAFVGLLGAFGAFRARVDAELEHKVRAAVREVMRARGALQQ